MNNRLGTRLGTQAAQLLIDGVPAFDEWIVRDPNYLEIVREVEEKCERVWEYGFSELDHRFLLIPRQFVKVVRVEKKDDSLVVTYQILTPKGKLTYVCEKKRSVFTVWDRKPLVESQGDVEKLLSIPYELQKSDVGDFLSYKRKIEEQEDSCILGSVFLWCLSLIFFTSRIFLSGAL